MDVLIISYNGIMGTPILVKNPITAEEYFTNIEKLKKEFSELGIFYTNLHCMSGTFRPHELYLTPQCGEYREHQIFLEKFAEINKSYIYEEGEY